MKVADRNDATSESFVQAADWSACKFLPLIDTDSVQAADNELSRVAAAIDVPAIRLPEYEAAEPAPPAGELDVQPCG